MKKTRCITLVVQFGKEGVDFGEMSDRLQALLYDGTACELVVAIPGVARSREETPVPSFPEWRYVSEIFDERDHAGWCPKRIGLPCDCFAEAV